MRGGLLDRYVADHRELVKVGLASPELAAQIPLRQIAIAYAAFDEYEIDNFVREAQEDAVAREVALYFADSDSASS